MKRLVSTFIILVFLSSGSVFVSCASSKNDCDCPTFGEKKQKNKKTRYRKY